MKTIAVKKTGIIGFFLFFLCSLFLFPEIAYFRSNSIGMKLDRITKKEIFTYDFFLEVETGGEKEKRILYEKAELKKKWEYSFYNNDTIREEREYDGEALISLRYYDRKGRLTEEDMYSNDLQSAKMLYSYNRNDELTQVKAFNSKGNLLYTEYYELSRNGMLRKVKRTESDGTIRESSFVYGKGQLLEEAFTDKDQMTISRYDDSGKLHIIEVWKGKTLLRIKTFQYEENGSTLLSSIEKDMQTNLAAEGIFDNQNRLARELLKKEDIVVSDTAYFYDEEGRKTRMKKISDNGLEEWAFIYNPEGELSQEEYYYRGILEKRTIYTGETTYYEELFRNGELLLRVYYEDNEKVKEEFIENGEIIRVRKLEKPQ